jgi:hypothetical protein
MGIHTVIKALRRFLPRFLASKPALSAAVWSAVRAIKKCRTPALGGQVFGCKDCDETHFAWHSCNHKACPQCGRAATALWVERQLEKLTGAPYFMVTFTLPAELRDLFFGEPAREAFDMFFAAASRALAQTLANPQWLGAKVSGFTAALHTWNQLLLFHPHIHFIVPGVGLDARGNVCRVKYASFLFPPEVIRAAFKQAFHKELEKRKWEVDPAVWTKDWGVDIQACGNGAAAVKYLGAYVARTAIADSRIVEVDDTHVTFRWKDRANGGRMETEKLEGVEFVRRYLRHVLPSKMHSVRHYGFCHPAAKKNRERVRFLTGMPLVIQSQEPAREEAQAAPKPGWPCPCCGLEMQLIAIHRPRRDSHAWPPPDGS